MQHNTTLGHVVKKSGKFSVKLKCAQSPLRTGTLASNWKIETGTKLVITEERGYIPIWMLHRVERYPAISECCNGYTTPDTTKCRKFKKDGASRGVALLHVLWNAGAFGCVVVVVVLHPIF